MHRVRPRLSAPLLVGVGAAFDFHAGLVSQAPPWMQRNGLEWVYRLSREPRRLWRRYVRYNPRFVAGFARQYARGSLPRSRSRSGFRAMTSTRRPLGADHRRHRPGRLLSGGAAAREGLRRARHGAPRLDGEVRPDRAPARPHHPAPGRPARPALARRRAARVAAERDLQPRGDVVRRGLLDPADADGRVHRRRRHADARGDARSLPRGALLPGLLVGDVRQGARGAPDGDDAVLSPLALRRGQGIRALHHCQLPRVIRPARDQRDTFQPRVAPAVGWSS